MIMTGQSFLRWHPSEISGWTPDNFFILAINNDYPLICQAEFTKGSPPGG